jgi:DNA-binding beta-propeller fold protein YncE
MQSRVRLAKLLFAVGFASCSLAPQIARADAAFVYINANPDRAGNSVTALLSTTDGQSSLVAGSPFATGGTGLAPLAGAEFAHRIEAASARNLLFVANDGSGSVSVFHVDPSRGALAAALGSPFAVAAGTPFSGISLAASSDGRFLYASSSELVSFFVDANGGLNEIGSRWAFSERVAGIAVSADNSRLFLSSASGITILHTGDGGLTADPPVTLSIGSNATDLRANAAGSSLWVSTQSGGIAAYAYQAGSASLVSGSPFFLGLSDLGGLAVDRLGESLVAYSPTALRLLGAQINSDGTLTLAPNSPVTPALAPTGAAFSPDGQRLVLADGLGQIDVWLRASNGALNHVSGYPIPTGAAHGFASVAMFPSATSVPAAPGAVVVALAALLLLIGSSSVLRRRASWRVRRVRSAD